LILEKSLDAQTGAALLTLLAANLDHADYFFNFLPILSLMLMPERLALSCR
jgi:hypothetical protein